MINEKKEAIRTANEYIDKLMTGISETSNRMYEGLEEEGISLIPEIADGIEYIYKIVTLTENVFGNVEDIDSINPCLGEIVEALENEDYILVGDLYKYEIIPILENVKLAFMKIV